MMCISASPRSPIECEVNGDTKFILAHLFNDTFNKGAGEDEHHVP